MKKLLVVLALLFGAAMPSEANFRSHGGVGVSFGVFYSSLSPYGEWIPFDGDVFAWRPVGVAVGWRPYMHGRWVWTDDGWYWASSEPWGWAVFHYGRWYYDDFYGWVWIPGYDWSPAWVEWRFGGPYVGWAPLGPYAVFRLHVGIHYSVHWLTPAFYWSFVDCRYISSPNVHRHVYRSEHNSRYIGRTRYSGSVRYDRGRIVTSGPDRDFVQRSGNVRVERTVIGDARAPGQERIVRDRSTQRVEVYRPQVESASRETALERPVRVRDTGPNLSLDTRATDVRREERTRGTDTEVRTPDRPREQRESVERQPRQVQARPETPREESGQVQRQQESQQKSVPRIERKAEQRQQPQRESVDRQRGTRDATSAGEPERITTRPGRGSEGRAVEVPRGGSRGAAPSREQRAKRDR